MRKLNIQRRYFQFGIRSLLLVMLLTGVGMSWCAYRKNRSDQQHKAVEEIVKLGAGVSYDYQVIGPDTYDTRIDTPGPVLLKNIFGDDFFRNVIRVDLYGNLDKSIPHLRKLRGLQILYISDQHLRLTDANLEMLGSLDELQSLTISGVNHGGDFSDLGIKHLQSLKCLRTVCLWGLNISASRFDRLESMPELKEIDLSGSEISHDGMENLTNISKLRTLKLSSTMISERGNKMHSDATDDSLAQYALDILCDYRIGNDEMKVIVKLQELNELDISDTKVSDSGITRLKSCKNLKSLDLSGTKISDQALLDLSKLSNLEFLNISNTFITDDGLEYIQNLKSLRSLDISGTRISDLGLQKLEKLHSLRALRISETKVTDAGIQDLINAIDGIQIN